MPVAKVPEILEGKVINPDSGPWEGFSTIPVRLEH